MIFSRRYLKRQTIDFVFLVQPRSVVDIHSNFPVTRYVPSWMLEHVLEYFVMIPLKHILGPRKSDGRPTRGLVISVPMVAHRILRDKKKAKKKILYILKVLEKNNVKYVGLGSLTSSVVGGGVDVAGRTGIYITNGNALTVAMTMRGIERSAKMRGVNISDATIAVLGATGSIGNAVSTLLVTQYHVKKIILIGRTEVNVRSLKESLASVTLNTNISATTTKEDMKDADIVIVATSGTGTLVSSEDVKSGAIIYDVTQPQNVSRTIKEKRHDVLVVDGGIISFPEEVSIPLDFGLAQGTTFSCLAETMIIAADELRKDFSVGHVNVINVEDVEQRALNHGFSLAPLRSFGKLVE
jgi:fatty aldehyde-generating acyl-ACP reductase